MDSNASGEKAAESSVKPTPAPEKNSQPAPAETVAPEPAPDEGVQTGGLRFVPNMDGTRLYPEQKPVETTGDPTPLPEENPSGDKPAEAKKTDLPVGQ